MRGKINIFLLVLAGIAAVGLYGKFAESVTAEKPPEMDKLQVYTDGMDLDDKLILQLSDYGAALEDDTVYYHLASSQLIPSDKIQIDVGQSVPLPEADSRLPEEQTGEEPGGQQSGGEPSGIQQEIQVSQGELPGQIGSNENQGQGEGKDEEPKDGNEEDGNEDPKEEAIILQVPVVVDDLTGEKRFVVVVQMDHAFYSKNVDIKAVAKYDGMFGYYTEVRFVPHGYSENEPFHIMTVLHRNQTSYISPELRATMKVAENTGGIIYYCDTTPDVNSMNDEVYDLYLLTPEVQEDSKRGPFPILSAIQQ